MMMVKGATEETFRVPLLDLIDHLFLTFSLVPSGKASVGVLPRQMLGLRRPRSGRLQNWWHFAPRPLS